MIKSREATIPIPCPHCGQETQKTIAWLEVNEAFACHGCGAPANLNRKELLGALGEIEKAIGHLRESLGGAR